MATPPESLSLRKVLSESERIIRLHRHHFLALSVLFLFPPSLVGLLYLTILKNLDVFQSEKISFSLQIRQLYQANQTPYHYLLLSLLYTLFSYLFSLFSVASISYSTYHASRDEPVDLISSIKSILYSFWPLVSTSLLLISLIWSLTITPFLLSLFLIYKWLYHSSYFIPLVVSIGLIFAVVLIYLQVNWILAYVVVAVESKWGYAPLKRSAYLVKGNRGVALSMMVYFGFVNGIFFWVFYGGRLGGWWYVMFVVIGSFLLSQVLLGSLVATAVLYLFCRDSNEGLPSQNPEKFPLLK